MKYILQTDNETIEIPIIRSKRKTLGLEVKYDGTVNARMQEFQCGHQERL